MVRGYRILQHWDQWLTQQFLGSHLLQTEHALMSKMLHRHFGKHALLIGVPAQYDLLLSTSIPWHSMLTPLPLKEEKKQRCIECDLDELPLLTGSIDLVILPHTLEFIDNPRQLLTEACRIVKPEGLIIICGFNPFSFWGFKKMMTKNKFMPWGANFIPAAKIKKWLKLSDFFLEKQQAILFRPPINYPPLHKKLQFLEQLGKCLPLLGGGYIIAARAKVAPLTPIRLKWKQQLSGIRISPTISGTIAR